MSASAPTYDGITSGRARTTRHTARPGMSVRVTNHALAVPRRAQGTDTSTARVSVFSSGRFAPSEVSTSIASAPSPTVRITR